MTNRKYLKQIVEELFENFLLDPLLSKSFPSFQNMTVLVNRITSLLDKNIIPAVKSKDTKTLSKYCYEIGKVHYHLQIPEVLMFKYINKFKKLLEKQRDFLNLAPWEIYFWIKNCKKWVALAYIKGMLKDAIDSIEETNFIAHYIKVSFKTLFEITQELITEKVNLDELINGLDRKNSSSIETLKKELLSELELSPIEKYFNSIEFHVKGYVNLDLKLKIESNYKYFKEFNKVFIEYLLQENFEYATYIIRELILKAFSILDTYKEIEFNWNIQSFEVFLHFLTDSYYSHGTLRLITVATESRKLKANILGLLYNELTDFLEKNNLHSFTFCCKKDDHICLYIDYFSPKYEDIIKGIESIVEKVSKRDNLALYLELKPLFAIGEINTNNFHNAPFLLMQEIFKLLIRYLNETRVKTEDYIIFQKFDCIFEDILLQALNNLKLIEILLQSIKRKNISLFYQPIVDIKNNNLLGIEILSRIPVEKNYVSPAFFIDFLMENQLTTEYDLAVLKTLYDNLERINLNTNRIFVNLFPDSLLDDDVIQAILNILEKAEKLNLTLVLELTEYSVVTRKEILEKIQQGNLEIAFDDFGSGYTNFKTVGMLASLNRAKYLKIDGELVKALRQNGIYESIIKGIASFAKGLNLGIVFEHVSDENLLNRVKSIAEEFQLEKVYGQGYYFGKPQPLFT